MEEKIILLSEKLKEAIKSDPRYIALNDAEKKMNEDKEVLSLAIAKEKAALLKDKCNDLVKYAKEKGTPVVEKTAKEVETKTAGVIRGVLTKLEDEEA